MQPSCNALEKIIFSVQILTFLSIPSIEKILESNQHLHSNVGVGVSKHDFSM